MFQVTKEQELGLDKNRRKFDIREEYYVCPHIVIASHIDSFRTQSGLTLRRTMHGTINVLLALPAFLNGAYLPQSDKSPQMNRDDP